MASKATKAVEDDDKKWRAESDLSTLIEAKKIMTDKARLKAAMAVRDEKLAALKSMGNGEGKE